MKKRMQKNDSAAQASRRSSFRLMIILMLWGFLPAGCAMWPEPTRSVHVGETGPMGDCADFFASLDGLTAASGALDSGYARVKHYPYLRSDRFIASFRDDVEDSHAFTAWVDFMQALDQSARQFEIANLSDTDIAAMDLVDGRKAIARKVVECGNLLKNAEVLNTENKRQMHRNVSVKDEYNSLRRVLGLYPITSVFVSRGVNQWHAEARERFSTEPSTDWQQTVRYVPVTKPGNRLAHRIIQGVEHDALGIPAYSADDRHTLFQEYAPVWEIQTQGDADRIGSPAWNGKGRIGVDTGRPQTYTHLSFTRFGNAIFTQLNYIIWFPSRPSDGAWDIYAGLLDGLNFRVTLDVKGDPILYETIHNCGCYYKAYPTSRLQVREKMDYAEPPLILKAPEMQPASEMMVVGMAHRTHYVTHLYSVSRKFEDSPHQATGSLRRKDENRFPVRSLNPPQATGNALAIATQSGAGTYTLADYGELKGLPQVDGKRISMFDRYGLVPGSERLERFILWPTGVLSPGAMRQWGRHAVAFVGKRHFDDPFYLDKMFVPTD